MLAHQVDPFSLVDDFTVDQDHINRGRMIEQTAFFYGNVGVFAHFERTDAVVYTEGTGNVITVRHRGILPCSC